MGIKRLEDIRDKLMLFLVDIRPIDFEQQDHTGLFRIVPRFMLTSVVKQPNLALLPFTGLVADPETTLSRHDQRQVDNQPGVYQSVVRRDMGAGP